MLEEYARKLAVTLLLEGVKSVDPMRLIKRNLKLERSRLIIHDKTELNLENGVYVIALGKAACRMAAAIEDLLGDTIRGGIATAPKGAPGYELRRIECVVAEHPYPGKGSMKAGRLALKIAREASSTGSPLIVLISGGGSAMMEVPVPEVRLEDMVSLTKLLLKSGATIDEVNAVRKHLSLVKGGRLAAAAHPAPVISLILSDVVGDRLDVIASGPTAPDPTTYADAKEVLERYNLLNSIPDSVRKVIFEGVDGKRPETPKPGEEIFERVTNLIIGNNLTALKAMKKYAETLGLNSIVLTSMLQGEAREAAKVLAAVALEVRHNSLPVSPPAAIICGGETTVTVRGRGRGGRNQEFALSAALQIAGEKGIAIAAMGSDGIDGVTDAAGAVVDGYTVPKARQLGLDPRRFLAENNSYEFFKAVGGHIFTGPTQTNVNDFYIAIVTTEEATW